MDASSLIQHRLHKEIQNNYRALLVGQYGSKVYPDKLAQEESLRELFTLADTARINSIKELFFRISHINTRFFFTTGFLERIQETIREKDTNLVIVDANLKPTQLRNLEEAFKVRVLGRVELILDIFAMRAKTKTASLQVEFAQLTYILPRLKGLGGVLSRLGGGIGARGPGETMLETDRRHIKRRIQKVEKELEVQSKHRSNTRKNRNIPTFALVGYTNAGKSSLLNQLSSSSKKLFAEDRLFATLDAFSRKVYLGEVDYKPLHVVVSDTIGFIRNLPASLVAAFQSTLEEIKYIDTIIVVVDSSSTTLEEEIQVVNKELERLGVETKEKIIFFNKDDLIALSERKKLYTKYPKAIWGNTLSKDGTKNLKDILFGKALEIYKT